MAISILIGMKDVAHWQNEALKKLDDFRGYSTDFSPEEFYAMGIVQDLLRAADSLAEAGQAVHGTLKAIFPRKFNDIYLLDDFGDEGSLISFVYPQSVSDPVIVDAMKSNEIYKHKSSGSDTFDVFMPLQGKDEIREQIGYPDNKECVIGSLRLWVPEKDMEHDGHYFKRIAGRAGYGLHHGVMLRELTHLNESMRVFGKTVSHDISSGVISVDGYIARALKRLPETHEASKILSKGRERLNKLQKLLWITSASSPYEMGRYAVKKEPVNLQTIMEDAADDQASDLENAGIALIKAYNAENPVILGDPAPLFSIDINLISNAIRHGDHKSITVGIEDEGAVYRNYVRNTGGMELDGKDVFQDGVKGNRSSGLGIGLWAVERNVRMLGGKIDVDTDGETFTQFNAYFKKP